MPPLAEPPCLNTNLPKRIRNGIRAKLDLRQRMVGDDRRLQVGGVQCGRTHPVADRRLWHYQPSIRRMAIVSRYQGRPRSHTF